MAAGRSSGAGGAVTPWWVVLLVALAMGVVGHLTGLRLATGGYRIDEDEAEHAPGRPWWPGLLTALLAALAAWAIGGAGDWAVLPTYLLFAWLTVGLIWIDLDVHRLPVGLVVPTAWWLAPLLVVATRGDRASRGGREPSSGRRSWAGSTSCSACCREAVWAVATSGSRRSSGRCWGG